MSRERHLGQQARYVLEEYRWLVEGGVPAVDAAARLGVTEDTIKSYTIWERKDHGEHRTARAHADAH